MSRASEEAIRVTVVGDAEAGGTWGPDDLPALDAPMPEIRPLPPRGLDRAMGRRRFEVCIGGWLFEVFVESEGHARLRERAGAGSAAVGELGIELVTARIPGRVVRLWVAEGDTVEPGQRLLAIEAMKMENEVRATRAGTIAAIRVGAGSSVELGDELLTVR